MVLLQPDPFLNELTSMYERNKEKGSVWVTLKRSPLASKVKMNKMKAAGEAIEYRCLVRATDGKRNISTSLSAKDHQRFQASYATLLKAHMDALKKEGAQRQEENHRWREETSGFEEAQPWQVLIGSKHVCERISFDFLKTFHFVVLPP
ncbi:unnamed protein product [Spirodela intermedia]|uniref:Signal recognition particle 14 kDa protein n=1 Tax=Spirodela intermedia TaxID=51605 RepID=A0A7I8JC77_SPIIN|nr:unnamed protein product [Spirodela intermedia]CAA6667729.1 unnamed protein product [Spirodela intermedia]